MMRDASSDDIVVFVLFFFKDKTEEEIDLDTDEQYIKSPLMSQRGHV